MSLGRWGVGLIAAAGIGAATLAATAGCERVPDALKAFYVQRPNTAGPFQPPTSASIDLVSHALNRLTFILLQDAWLLAAGFLVEYANKRWLHSEEPLFQLALSLSSALFFSLFAIRSMLHVVKYVRGQIAADAARRMNHLWSAGITYQGAWSCEVFESRSS